MNELQQPPPTSRRGRTPVPQTRLSANERLLSAADELFYSQGIVSTGVDAVIERAGVATGSLYNNFSGKDALVSAYLSARDHRWRTHWEACIAERTDPGERVLALFTAVHLWDHGGSEGNRGCAHVAAAVQLPADHPGAQVALQHKEHLAARLRELCTETGDQHPADLAQDLLLIYEGMQTMITMSLDPHPIARARRLARERLTRAQ